MKKRESGIIRCKADFHFLVSADHHNVFHHPRQRFPGNPGELERVTMKMDGMYIIASVAHAEAIALALAEMIGGSHRLAGKHLVVNRPQIEAMVRGVLLCKGH